MKSLLQKSTLETIEHRLEAATRLLLFVDFDDILMPAASKGLSMPLTDDDREFFREISEKTTISLAFTSNLSMTELKRLIGFSGIYLIANNGLEISGPDLNVVHGEAKKARRILEPVVRSLENNLKELPGIVLDNRHYSLALNMANARASVQRKARILTEQVWTAVMDNFTLLETRHELVLRPRIGWGKNRAVMFIWNKFASPRRRPLVMYVGSDDLDEDIFTMMGKEGIGIVVGGTARVERSKAGYMLKNRAEVYRYIDWLKKNASRIKAPGMSV